MNNKIKSLLALKGLNMVRYAEHMSMSRSALGNKEKRGSWTAKDLIKLAELTETRLCFLDENKVVMDLDIKDIDNNN